MKKLIFSLAFATISFFAFAQTADEVAIKTVIEKETTTWMEGDVKGHADCWKVQPYSRILVSLTDGSVLDVDPKLMLNPSPGIMGGGGTFSNSKYVITTNGNTAWVSHNEDKTAKDGKKSYSYETRYLEKFDGAWKLVGETVMHYTPK